MSDALTFNPTRIDTARLEANMSHADLAFEIRRRTDGRLKPTPHAVGRWIRGEHTPREGVVAAIAAATGKEITFFYESDDEEDDPDLSRDLARLPAELRRRIERRLARSVAR